MTRNVQVGMTIAIGLVLGVFVGLLIPQNGVRSAVVSATDRLVGSSIDEKVAEPTADDPHAGEDLSGLVAITKTAALNLGLLTRRLKPDNFQSHRSIPSVVRERPAVSNMQVSSSYHCVVTKVFAVPGQAVRPNEPLFEVKLIGDQLASTQSELLSTMQQIKNTTAKIDRISGLATRSGGTTKREVTFLELERTALKSTQDNLKQQLLIRGLTEAQVQQIVQQGKLVRTATIHAPDANPDRTTAGSSTSQPVDSTAIAKPDEWAYTVEDLHISSGTTVQPGEELCEIAWHATLFIEGQAFENDIPLIRERMLGKRPVSVELGSDDAPVRIGDRRILYIDNRVVANDQFFRFYLPLDNEILGDTFDSGGRRFRSWRFKPGQRGHVLVPDKKFDNCFVLPAVAVAEDGNESVVFRRYHSHGDEVEYKAVKVHVLYRDSRTVVLGRDGELKSGDRIAENSAYQLLLAMKAAAAGGGGGHHHDHDH